MIRLSALFWLILVSASGFAMFAVKYEVQALADQLARTTSRTAQAEHEVRVLDAEWAYLNRPDALAQMNQRYLSLAPIATKQLYASVTDIPMRPVPPPPVETAAATPAPAPMQETATDAPRPASSAATTAISPERTAPVLTAALDTRVAAAEPVRPAPVRAVFRPRPAHGARSLDALIAQIVETR